MITVALIVAILGLVYAEQRTTRYEQPLRLVAVAMTAVLLTRLVT